MGYRLRPLRPSSATWSRMGVHFTEWVQGALLRGRPKRTHSCSHGRGRHTLIRRCLNFFNFNRSRMRAQGEGRESIRMGRNASSTHILQFNSETLDGAACPCPNSRHQCLARHTCPSSTHVTSRTRHWAGSQQSHCAQLAACFHGQAVHGWGPLLHSFTSQPSISCPVTLNKEQIAEIPLNTFPE